MAHTTCLINFYRIFDLCSLAQIGCYTSYDLAYIVSASENNRYSNFKFIQQNLLFKNDVEYFQVSPHILSDCDLFIDADHLSDDGAALFTDSLYSFLSQKFPDIVK
jgi:hypothetical protein